METTDQPLITVITVTYNSAMYVKNAIESILYSSLTDLELIVGDDCSKDGTWNIIQSYTDPRLVTYRNTVNIGEYPNRNKAIQLARGKYILFIDGDDMVYPHGLEFMVKMLEAFPECGMALMRWFKNNLFYPVVITPHQFYVGQYFGFGFLDTAFSNVLFNAAILKSEGGLSLEYRAGDDFIRYKIAGKYSSLLINDGLTWWRETPGQASGRFVDKFENVEMRLSFLRSPECPLDIFMKKKAEENIYLVVVKTCIREALKLRLVYAVSVLFRFKIPLRHIFTPFKKPFTLDPFSSFTPSQPYQLDFKNNPFSK